MEIQTDNPQEGYPFPCFSYDETNAVVLNTGYILCSRSVDVRYILGVLNSSLGKFLVKLYVTQLQEKQFRMLAQYVNIMPIPIPTAEQYSNVVELVGMVLKQHHQEDEMEINKAVYGIFNLSSEEIAFIESKQEPL